MGRSEVVMSMMIGGERIVRRREEEGERTGLPPWSNNFCSGKNVNKICAVKMKARQAPMTLYKLVSHDVRNKTTNLRG